ncbi:MAG: hypothetical protein AAFY71_21710 [Bacteroidota bacterium]
MKKLFVHILLMILGLAVACLSFPLDKRNRYQQLNAECLEKSGWIYDRIHLSDTPIDIAFIGSSHTINGVNDSLLEANLSHNMHVSNLGYCRLGRDLHFEILQELVQSKQPKKLVLEIGWEENRFSHPSFAQLADPQDILMAYPIMNGSYFPNILNLFRERLIRIQKRLWNPTSPSTENRLPHGFTTVPNKAEISVLEASRTRLSKKKRPSPAIRRNLLEAFPNYYLDYISSFCRQHQIELSFLYLPPFGCQPLEQKEKDFYKRMGELWIPPASILDEPSNWYDAGHFNLEGAEQLSLWLAKKL